MNARKRNQPLNALTNFIITIATGIKTTTLPWLKILFLGAVLVKRGFQVSQWITAAGRQNDYHQLYYQLNKTGANVELFSKNLPDFVTTTFGQLSPKNGVTVIIFDDSPTKHYGQKIEGAGYHHNPTPSKTDATLLFGHNWVNMAQVIKDGQGGVKSIPLDVRMYIRDVDIEKLPPPQRIQHSFKTKNEMAAEMLEEYDKQQKDRDFEVEIAFDGAYTNEIVIGKAVSLGIHCFGRLRKDAKVFDLPEQPEKRDRGRPKKYGERFYLHDTANCEHCSWTMATVSLYGKNRLVEYKSFVCTSKIMNGKAMRVVLTRYVEIQKMPNGKMHKKVSNWIPLMTTKKEATPEEVIETYGYRFSIEEMFKDMKEVCGLEEQEVRKLDSCVGAYWLCLLSYVFIESWSLESGARLQNEHLRGPWDRSGRRISHAEKRKLFHQLVFREEFLQLLPGKLNSEILKILENPLFLNP
ncbi:MAG: IS701 family transposase [Thermoguttaceae bacterium]